MAKPFTDRDLGYKKILREFRKASRGVSADIGIQAPAANADHGGVTNVMLGVIHEFGVSQKNIPERSFMRSTVDRHQAKYLKTVESMLPGFVDGRSNPQRIVGAVGEKVASDIKGTLTAGVPPALSPARAKQRLAKGTGIRPLHDTEQLKGSITVSVK